MKNDLDAIKKLADETGFTHLHLGVSPALGADGKSYLAKVKATGLEVSATMIDFAHEDYSTLESIRLTGGIVPDEHWAADKAAVFAAIDATVELGVDLLSLHFGFLDMEDADMAGKLLERASVLGDYAQANGITLLMETGQETAEELKGFLETLSHPAFAVNFDPANMILYGKGNPIDVVKVLAPWIKHVHIKDATKTETPGTWGAEVPWSTGQVNADEFLKALKDIGFEGALAVEREAGDDRPGDITLAIKHLIAFKG